MCSSLLELAPGSRDLSQTMSKFKIHYFHPKWSKLPFWVKTVVIFWVAQLVTTLNFFLSLRSAWSNSQVKKCTWHVDLLSRSPELPVKNYRNSQDSAISSSTGCPGSAESGRRHSRRQSDILAKRQEDNSRGVQGYLNHIPLLGVRGKLCPPYRTAWLHLVRTYHWGTMIIFTILLKNKYLHCAWFCTSL